MATVPTPLDATAGDKGSAAAFDTGVRDPLNWVLGNYPRSHSYASGSLACLNAVAKLITFDSEVYDNDSMHSTSVNTSRVTFTTPGLYRHIIRVHLATATFSTLTLTINKNSGGAVGGGTTLAALDFKAAAAGPGNCFIVFNWPYTVSTDYIEMFITQAPGASVGTAAGALETYCQVEWIAVS